VSEDADGGKLNHTLVDQPVEPVATTPGMVTLNGTTYNMNKLWPVPPGWDDARPGYDWDALWEKPRRSRYDALWDQYDTARARPTTPPSRAPGTGTTTPYGLAALAGEVAAVTNAPEGTRNDTLNRAGFSIGQLVAGGEIDHDAARAALAAAGHTAGLGDSEIRATLASGLGAGMEDPRAAPPSFLDAARAAKLHLDTPGAEPDPDAETDAPADTVHRGQVRIAYRFAAKFGGRLMFVPKIGWHVWDGTRWALDERGAATRAVLATLRKALADSIGDDSGLREDVRKCEGAAGIRGVLDIAGNLEPFVVSADELDADPYLLNVANGTLDLRTRELRAHDPADRITKITRAAYRPGETGSGAWSAFLAQVLPDRDVQAFLQRLIGVALLGKVIEHVLPIMTGTGANGKGVTYGALLHALGDYAAPAEPELFMAREGAHPTGQMDLFGRRLVVVSESDRNRRLSEATMKRLTGGDPIKARYMRQEFVTFTPSHLALLVTNHLPKVSGDDDAIWRRVRVVPFDVVIPEDHQDVHLGESLELEADAVLAWAVDGYADYAAHGLAEPENVRVATEAYRTDSDAVARFMVERCYLNPNVRAVTADLHNAFTAWAVTDGAEPMSQRAFGHALDRHGYPAAKASSGKRWRAGIELLDADQDATNDTEWRPF